MYTSFVTLTTLALGLATSVSAVGKAQVINNCDVDISVWSVGSAVDGPWRLSANGGSYAEQFVKDPTTGGKALKITIPADGLYTGAPQTNFAYSLDNDKIWYDLSDVFGDPFPGQKLVVSSAASCPSIVWPAGTSPGGSQTKVCGSDQDVTFTLCSA
ncbi:hypothetical protein CONLIGDRAFT_635389 [Coniochaeta ligniaria NRRL 30616]|uniref:Bys1 family protein n=1 Tax=Coniochaeta ligniaria NRRL 30616 TaxID=1408157 RepID=A0A1J7IDL5_9PEZI|nr:hypothetical protein CONLIGDRAFT_635389 [Coniochaeta ligniaria NRRL 30616]